MEHESDRYIVLSLLRGVNVAVLPVEDRECFLAKRYGVETKSRQGAKTILRCSKSAIPVCETLSLAARQAASLGALNQ
jgi:hypothetical protein